MSDPIPSWWRRHLASWTDADQVTQHPWLKPLAGRLRHRSLWRLRCESVARGAAVGLFWAFVLPAGQIAAVVAHCSVWRANIPVAALMTLVTNPLTIGFWWWLAYHLGAWVLGAPAPADPDSLGAEGVGAWLSAYGWPAVVGMATLALGSATVGYLGVKLVWRLHRVLPWHRRPRRN